MSEYINPQRIVSENGVNDSAQILDDAKVQVLFNTDECAEIKNGGYILLDFGKEINGGIVITTQSVSNENAKYKIVFGESVTEALSELGEKNSGNYHSVRDMTVSAVNMSTQRFGQTGFRFVRIKAVEGDILVRAIKAVPEIRDIEYKGSFECDDELLNEIWNTGAYTVQLNMHEYLWDGIKRDRLVWIGDMHPETSVIKSVFGDDKCVRKSLDLLKHDVTVSGKWMNGFPTYTFWWVIIHYDWYVQWGDVEYLKEQRELMLKIADKMFSLAENDFVPELPGEVFVDWSSVGDGGEQEGLMSIACIAFESLEKIFDIFADKDYAVKCGKYHRILQNKKVGETELNNRLAALAVLAGRYSEKTMNILTQTTENEMSCFMGYYILNALAATGQHERALELIRNYWGAMLNLGATTFWEEFKMDWAKNASRIDEIPTDGQSDIHGDFGEHCYEKYRLSLCHGWACGPTAFLTEHIGGIQILEPGCKKMKITPNLGGLKHIKVKFPTPYGIVEVESENADGKTETKITAPKEIEIVQ